MSTHLLSISEAGFEALFTEVISARALDTLLQEFRRSPAGAPPQLPGSRLIMGLVFHVLLPCGLLSAHMRQLTGHHLGDSALSERRETMGADLFQAMLAQALRPLAEPTTHPPPSTKVYVWSASMAPPGVSRTRRRSSPASARPAVGATTGVRVLLREIYARVRCRSGR